MRLDADDMTNILESIRDEGMECQWEVVTSEADDPDRPWEGGEGEPTTETVWIAFVDMATAAALLSQWGKGTDISSSTLFGLMGNHGFDPSVGQRVLRGAREALVVKDITEAAPAGVALFYLLEFSA